jgi:hypothetical protein
MKCRVVIVLLLEIISLRCMPITRIEKQVRRTEKQVTSNTYALETRIPYVNE